MSLCGVISGKGITQKRTERYMKENESDAETRIDYKKERCWNIIGKKLKNLNPIHYFAGVLISRKRYKNAW